DQVGAQGPAGAEVAEDPGHVRYAGEQDAAPGDRFIECERPPVDRELDVAEDIEVEAGGGDDHIGREVLARGEPDALGVEGLDVVGYDRGGARGDRPEQVGVR